MSDGNRRVVAGGVTQTLLHRLCAREALADTQAPSRGTRAYQKSLPGPVFADVPSAGAARVTNTRAACVTAQGHLRAVCSYHKQSKRWAGAEQEHVTEKMHRWDSEMSV